MKLIFILLVMIVSLSCATKGVNPNSEPSVKAEPLKYPVILVFRGEKGREEFNVNCSLSVTEASENSDILRKRYENLDFKTKTVTKKILQNGDLIQDISTIQRDGPGSLHDLAYPEEGETIEMEIDSFGNVVKAGNYPKNSLFYLPSIPLPTHPVKLNEEWISTSHWQSDTTGIALTVSLKLKVIGEKPCGEHICANVDVTGDVLAPQPKSSKQRFKHHITGRFLFDVKSGLVPWSEFGSDEQLLGEGAKLAVHSKLRSELVQPPGYRTINHEEPGCPFETKE
jgi:hypothetical protein